MGSWSNFHLAFVADVPEYPEFLTVSLGSGGHASGPSVTPHISLYKFSQ
jgi:hypothetical protein